MVKQNKVTRERIRLTIRSRFFIAVILFGSSAFARPDSLQSFTLSAGTEYFDVFRQTSDRSKTTVLSRSTFVNISAYRNSDTLALSYNESTDYAAFLQRNSKTNFSTTISLQTGSAEYSGFIYPFRYKAFIGSSLNTPEYLFLYGMLVELNPWNNLFLTSASFQNSPSSFNNTVLFQDYLVHFDEVPRSSQWSFALQVAPSQQIFGGVSFTTSKAETHAPVTEYGTSSSHIFQSWKANGRYKFDEETWCAVQFGSNEYSSEIILKQDDVSFSSFSDGALQHTEYGIEAHTNLFSMPLSIQYTFDETKFSGFGHIESWPFTSFAKSIIANRLLYQTTGTLKQHMITSAGQFLFDDVSVLVAGSYYRILPDIILEHWEPEFLVFGMKNFVRNPFSMQDIHLGNIKVSAEFPLLTSRMIIFAEQYIPLSITYRTFQTVQPTPPPAPTKESPPATDGGRRFGIQCTISL